MSEFMIAVVKSLREIMILLIKDLLGILSIKRN
jgi:hypothetical protein